MDMSRYRSLFFAEAREHLDTMGRLLVALEKNGADREGIDALFREAHSVKGMAAAMGFERTAELSHALEDLLDGLRRAGRAAPAQIDRLLAGVDLLSGLVEDLREGRAERDITAFVNGARALAPEPQTSGSGPDSDAAGAPAPTQREWQIALELAPGTPAPAARLLLIHHRIGAWGRILSSSPDAAALAAGEGRHSLQLRLQSERDAEELQTLLRAFSEISRLRVEPPREERERLPSRREEQARTVRVRTEVLDEFIHLAGEMITNRHRLQMAEKGRDWQELRGGIDSMARLVTDLRHHTLRVRMTPLGGITGHLPRLVRDLARKNGKEVAFAVEGEELELDRAILEELADPLVHLVRNAVDHGIDKRGRVQVRAGRDKDLALIEVSDDGRGIDPEALRRKAVADGLLSPAQARALRDRDALQLICRPGFSTAAAVTSTSGRGVGMDVVKNAVENLGGSLEILSAPGAGTCMRLRLPLSVAIIQVLMVECDGCRLGIPFTRVLRLLSLGREEIQSSGRKLVTRLGDEVLPLLSLRKILRRPAVHLPGAIPVVVTEAQGRRFGLVVDALVGQREIFVKPLDYPLNRLSGISGGSILGDGQILFLIDPHQLLHERSLPVPEPAGADP